MRLSATIDNPTNLDDRVTVVFTMADIGGPLNSNQLSDLRDWMQYVEANVIKVERNRQRQRPPQVLTPYDSEQF